ncbi:hypothetical protein AAG570_002582 [Ranatra chinensis]|uniref:Adenosine kinase n=1 Tax=Ranatra chinensis TaxID=642074 RepID=A0ABD0Y8W9_9HEMI
MLLGMGNPLLDMSAVVNEDLLVKYGMKPNDAILAADKHMPLYTELVDKYSVEYIAGGSSQNSLRVAQWILEKPKVAVLIGCVGRDDYSKILEKKAMGDGVCVKYQYTDDKPTGTCAVLITKNGTNRSLCANLAAAELFTIDHIRRPDVRQAIEQAEVYYSSGFFLTVSIETIVEIAQIALKRDKIFMMNLSAPFLSQFYKENMMRAMPYVDILFGNETEALTFAREHNFDTEDMHKVALKIAALPKQNPDRQRIVVITQGSDPVIVVEGGKCREFPVVFLPSEKVVDTNGAGDAFVGGFMAQLVKRRPIETCIKCAIWTATQIVQRSGCTFSGKPEFDE